MLNQISIEDATVHDVSNKTWPQTQSDQHDATQPVVVLAGDGVGPEVMDACTKVLKTACPRLDWISAEAGSAALAKGVATGLPGETVDVISETGVALRGPLAGTTGQACSSASVLLRNMFELYGNVRPVRQLPYPGLPYAYSDIDVVVVRGNGNAPDRTIEHMQTPDVAQSLRLVANRECESIARLGFALAEAGNRTKVHCATRADGLMLTEGMFRKVFEEVTGDFADIAARTIHIEDCAREMLAAPEDFEIIITSDLNANLVSDLATSLVGGFGRSAAAEIGSHAAVFEPLHGPAPLLAGQNRVNPTAMILSGVMMLRHLGMAHEADCVEQALRRVYQEGATLPEDIALPGHAAGTDEFTDAIIEQLDLTTPALEKPRSGTFQVPAAKIKPRSKTRRRLDGLDIFVEWRGSAEDLAARVEPFGDPKGFQLCMISNQSPQKHPHGRAGVGGNDHWLCRFRYGGKRRAAEEQVAPLLARLATAVRWMHVEKLTAFNGSPGFTPIENEV